MSNYTNYTNLTALGNEHTSYNFVDSCVARF